MGRWLLPMRKWGSVVSSYGKQRLNLVEIQPFRAFPEGVSQGLKPPIFYVAVYGTTKVVP